MNNNSMNRVFIKSNNSVNKIYNRYLLCLILYVLLFIVLNLLSGSKLVIGNFIKILFVSLLVSSFLQYMINIFKKNKNILKVFLDDKILIIVLILSLFLVDCPILVVVISNIITVVIKNIFKNTSISSSLYGILFILLYKYYLGNIDTPLYNLSSLGYVSEYSTAVLSYGNIIDYTIGLNNIYLSPILAIFCFIYLFFKKSIKYNIFISYILTFSFIMLVFGLFNGMNIWYLFFQLTTGNILFLAVFCLTNYPNSPILYEGQVIYGILLGIITSVLRFSVPELSVVISLILGSILLTKYINKISYKFKYDRKNYSLAKVICIILVLIVCVLLNIFI